jgi:hypothetical protein
MYLYDREQPPAAPTMGFASSQITPALADAVGEAPSAGSPRQRPMLAHVIAISRNASMIARHHVRQPAGALIGRFVNQAQLCSHLGEEAYGEFDGPARREHCDALQWDW